jgi:hypothetical protein
MRIMYLYKWKQTEWVVNYIQKNKEQFLYLVWTGKRMNFSRWN